jgi:hypothetical protein
LLIDVRESTKISQIHSQLRGKIIASSKRKIKSARYYLLSKEMELTKMKL